MNTNNILSKCVDELQKKDPNISYVLGMLETIISMSGGNISPVIRPNILGDIQAGVGVIKSDEEIEQERLARQYETGPVAGLA